jgi:hypothetical protein
MPFTKDQVDSYLNRHACPYCGSEDIEEEKSIGVEVYRMGCCSCERSWYEHWQCYDITEIDD